MSEMEGMVEKVARALRDADAIWAARSYPDKTAEEIRQFVEGAADACGYEDMARAAILAAIPHVDRINALLERKVRYETALRSIAANTCCDKCQEAALVAQSALSEPS